MPPFLAKYYNLRSNLYAQIRSVSVLSTSDIISFITSVAEEDGSTWSSLESAHIEESLRRMGANDWLKVAIQFDRNNSNLDNPTKKFIIITKQTSEPCVLPGKEYNIFKMSGTHFLHPCLWTLWACLVTLPWVLFTDVAARCCLCLDLSANHLLTKQYVAQYNGASKV